MIGIGVQRSRVVAEWAQALRWQLWYLRCWWRSTSSRVSARCGFATDSVRWPLRRWALLIGVVATLVGVAITTNVRGPASDPAMRPAVEAARQALSQIVAIASRPSRKDYQRTAFGPAWSDAAPVTGGGNGCDTRNDILRRDLAEITTGPSAGCRDAVLSGKFRSPYTGEVETFRRGRGASAVQIDHIVALAYAWDMGAWSWTPTRRLQLANDPANLVAVDAHSNQAKSDGEPAAWMPELRGFRCCYAIQFTLVTAAYQLKLDEASRRTITAALDQC